MKDIEEANDAFLVFFLSSYIETLKKSFQSWFYRSRATLDDEYHPFILLIHVWRKHKLLHPFSWDAYAYHQSTDC